jgi:hypothetical protein
VPHGGLAIAGPLVEVRAHRIEPIVPGDPLVAIELADQLESARGGSIARELRADVRRSQSRPHCLLGLNLLSDFNFEIRPAERRILVEKIAP